MPGGAVVDFVITLHPSTPVALRVQSYWHENPTAQAFDEAQVAHILAAGYQVEDIWETEIRDVNVLNQRMWQIVYGL